MKPLFTTQEFNNARSYDKLALECKICKSTFFKQKRLIKWTQNNDQLKYKGRISSYCSTKCQRNDNSVRKIYQCKNCTKEVSKIPSELRPNRNIFCSKSCAATYNNLHKTSGNRRSKLEIWLEEQLNMEKYDFEILFNNKEIINSELDIYIPSLKLAFELNGIYHYEPIHGQDKFNQIQNNDKRKFQACLENNIELCIIDSSGLKYNKPEKFKKFLNIIKQIIENKLKL